MEYLKDYFKDRKQVEQFFNGVTFKFKFMSDNMAEFRTVIPINFNQEYLNFSVTFFTEDSSEFFCYSNFSDWFERLQLFEVMAISEETHKSESMYLRNYVDSK